MAQPEALKVDLEGGAAGLSPQSASVLLRGPEHCEKTTLGALAHLLFPPSPPPHLWFSPGCHAKELCHIEPPRKLGDVFIIFIIYTQELGGRVNLLLIYSAYLPPRLETHFQLDQDLI